jgi:predicted ATP-grasp superfamily ATP-dependent carboligase
MKVFLAEYACGGGFIGTPTERIDDAFRLEGTAMTSAMADDLSKVAEVVVPIDPRFRPNLRLPEGSHEHVIRARGALWGQWAKAAEGCDAAIIIAPEKDGILAKAVGMLRASGVDVVAGSGDFLRVASDKQQTARALHAAGVQHPATLIPNDAKSLARLREAAKIIVKPRDGCGTESIRVYEDLEHALKAASDGDVVQSFVPGLPASVSVIVHGGEVVVLPAVSQDIAIDNCAYRGGSGPLENEYQRRAASLAECAIAAMPAGPRGFVGIDIVLGEDAGGDYVIEINPRLTTSYVGLRKMVAGNLAARMLGLQYGPVQCKTGPNEVRWTRDGHVWVGGEAADHA